MKTAIRLAVLAFAISAGPSLLWAHDDGANKDVKHWAAVAAAKAKAKANDDAPNSPFDLVVAFLDLQPEQATQLQLLLQARSQALAPVTQALGQLQQQLQQLLGNGGAPADVGQVVIQLHTLQQQMVQIQLQFQANFQALLTQDQQQRLGALQLAAQLQPIVPAFQGLGLL